MAKRKSREDRLPLHKKEKLCRTESADVVSGGDHSAEHEEIAVPKAITPTAIKNCPIFVLEQASLKAGLVRKKRKILDATQDHDYSLLKKQGKNPNDYRPDIFYTALRGILDSKLNKKGGIGAVYVKTDSGVLFEVKPHVRIPRSMKRFCGIMLDLLDKSCVRAEKTGEVFFRVLKGPLTQHLPANARILGVSYSSPKVVDIEDYLCAANDGSSLVFVVGVMADGKVNKDGMDDYLSVSNYQLCSRYCLELICQGLEEKSEIH